MIVRDCCLSKNPGSLVSNFIPATEAAMMHRVNTIREAAYPLDPLALMRHLSVVLLVLLVSFSTISASTPTDGSTPLGLAPGPVAGSYALSGFDNINPYNGRLNFSLPLMRVGGRGEASYTMSLTLDRIWQVDSGEIGGFMFYNVSANWWTGSKPGYGPGVLQMRHGGDGFFQCGWPQTTLTRLTFIHPDGSEMELRDVATNGQPKNVLCFQSLSRGSTFTTSDGTSATFISTDTQGNPTQILDHTGILYPSGFLMFRDGLRYRINDGLVTWMRDRNGNQLSFTYDGNRRVTQITDSLNRKVNIVYANMATVMYDEISFKGFAAQQRSIKIWYQNLGDRLRTGFTSQSIDQLFGNLNGGTVSTEPKYNPKVPASVELPNSQRYELYYNPYEEISRVELPTGGAYEYDYIPTSGLTTSSFGAVYIYRTVKERRVYPDGGTGATFESKMVYNSSVSGSPGTFVTTATVDMFDASTPAVLLAREKHYYFGDPQESLRGITSATSYPRAFEGREFKTESYSGGATPTLLHKTEYTWRQRAPVSWWTGALDSAPPNDPRVVETVKTLADTNQVSKVSSINPNNSNHIGYDQYNNQTDVWEYGLGQGASGPLVRYTHTDYLKTNSINNLAYDTVNPSSVTPNVNSTIHVRDVPTLVSIFDAQSKLRMQTKFEYDNYSQDTSHAALKDQTGISGILSRNGLGIAQGYNPTIDFGRCNMTASTRYLLDSEGDVTGSINTYTQYDIAGNIVKTLDPRNNVVTIDYRDNFGALTDAVQSSGAPTNSPPADLAGLTTYAFPFAVTNAMDHTTYTKYDFSLGKAVATEDANGVKTTFAYNEELDRATQVVRGANQGASEKSQSAFAYDDANRIVTTTTDLESFNDNSVRSQTLYDGLGRTKETRNYEDATRYIAVQIQYDSLGRAFKTSNPFRPLAPASETPVWTTTLFDSLGRVTSVTTPDNAIVRSAYDGSRVLITEQTNKQRITETDAFGRLTAVWEIVPADTEDTAWVSVSFPNHPEVTAGYLTRYTYDVVDNLTKVTQRVGTNGTQQTRDFAYDSLKRLKSTVHPESGNTSYEYDEAGNLTQRTDGRGVVTTYAPYDPANRITTKSYSDGTPSVTYTYDAPGVPNSKGRVTAASSSVSTYSYTNYDALGRTRTATQTLDGNVYLLNYTYDLAGHVKKITYPSGNSVTYNYDAAGRLADKDGQNLAFTGTLGGAPRNYSTGIVYSAFGGVTKEQFGTDTAIFNRLFYNSRGQLAEIRASTSSTDPDGFNRGKIINWYSLQCGGRSCNATDNNGNIRKQEVYVPNNEQNSTHTTWHQQYDYDSLNRLKRVRENTGNTALDSQQEYDIDRFGNRQINQANTWGPGIPEPNFGVDAATNRLTAPSGHTMNYDSAGQLTLDTFANSGTRAYDAENRLSSITFAASSTPQIRYRYDADGNRVRRILPTGEVWQIYGLDGELLAEYLASAPTTAQVEYGYRSGQLLITASTAAANWGPPPSFTPPAELVPGLEMKLEHLTELRSAVNALRSHAGLPAASFTADPNPVRFITQVRADHILQLRAALEPARQNLGLSIGGYAHSNLQTGDPIFAIDFQELRNQVLSAWNTSTGADIRWMVTDQLGTPRVTFDKTGTLENTKRHDYLPFGEELTNQGLRTPQLGYSGDNIRQKFSQKERDPETGLDYFIARYYSSTQGRFTSPDYIEDNPANLTNNFDHASALPHSSLLNPQTLNSYSYAFNNPLTVIDPSGHSGERIALTDKAGKKTGYTMRVEGGEYDSPNIHVFDRKGKEVGRFSLKPGEVGFTNAKKLPAHIQQAVRDYAAAKWGAENVARGVPGRAYQESFNARQAAAAEESTASKSSKGGKGGKGGRATSSVFTALLILQIGLEAYIQHHDRQNHGYYYDFFGRLIITNLEKASQNLPRGTQLGYKGIVFTFTGKQWLSPNCGGMRLVPGKDGAPPTIVGGC
jgi:RHS repeat-associated protein